MNHSQFDNLTTRLYLNLDINVWQKMREQHSKNDLISHLPIAKRHSEIVPCFKIWKKLIDIILRSRRLRQKCLSHIFCFSLKYKDFLSFATYSIYPQISAFTNNVFFNTNQLFIICNKVYSNQYWNNKCKHHYIRDDMLNS